MAEPTDTFAELTRRGHEVFAAAVQAWDQAARSLAEAARRPESGLPDVRASIDAAFDFAAKMLADQREFTASLLAMKSQVAAGSAEPEAAAAPDAPPRSVQHRAPAVLARPGGRQAAPCRRAPTAAPAATVATATHRRRRAPRCTASTGPPPRPRPEAGTPTVEPTADPPRARRRGAGGTGEDGGSSRRSGGDGARGDDGGRRKGGRAGGEDPGEASPGQASPREEGPGEEDPGEEDDGEDGGRRPEGDGSRPEGDGSGGAEHGTGTRRRRHARREARTGEAPDRPPHRPELTAVGSAARVQPQRQFAEQVGKPVPLRVVQSVERLRLGREVGGQQGVEPLPPGVGQDDTDAPPVPG